MPIDQRMTFLEIVEHLVLGVSLPVKREGEPTPEPVAAEERPEARPAFEGADE
jgi:hypothetical protein